MNRSRVKGSRFEVEVCSWLAAHGFPYAERRAMRGKNDCGDIAGIPGTVWELKATREIDLAGAIDEAEKEKANAGAQFAFAVIKRRNRGVSQAYMVMTLEQGARLLSEEG